VTAQERKRYTIYIGAREDRRDRFRWHVYEGDRLRDSSLHNFATRDAAKADAERFIAELALVWESAG
jgi:hypothetical protein